MDRARAQKDAVVLGSKYALKFKRDAQGRVKEYKARLCADRSRQETVWESQTSPVVSTLAYYTALHEAVICGLHTQQVVIRSAFVHTKLDADNPIYMQLPKVYDEVEKTDVSSKYYAKLEYGSKEAYRS